MEEYHIDFYNLDTTIREIIKNKLIDDEEHEDYVLFESEELDVY